MSQKRKLLVCSYDYRPRLGGVATCSFEIVRQLHEFGVFEIHLIVPEMEGGEIFDQDSPFKVSRIGLPTRAFRAVIPLSRAIRRISREWGPDAILNFLWLPEGIATQVSFFANQKIPYFVYAHAVELVESKRNLKKRLRGMFSPLKEQCFQSAAQSFPVSHFTGGLLERECGLKKNQYTVVYNGVDTKSFFPTAKSPQLEERHGVKDEVVLLSVCRLVNHKGVDRSLEALAQIKELSWTYLICGEGPERDKLENLTRELSLSDRVKFVGRIENEDLCDYYNLADIFVQLSREDWETPNIEGFGISFLEAGACEVPSLAGRSGGVPDAVVDGETGVLVNPDRRDEVIKGFRRLIQDTELRLRLGQNARIRASETLSWEKVAESVQSCIQKVIG